MQQEQVSFSKKKKNYLFVGQTVGFIHMSLPAMKIMGRD
jgi:hypothetical protein